MNAQPQHIKYAQKKSLPLVFVQLQIIYLLSLSLSLFISLSLSLSLSLSKKSPFKEHSASLCPLITGVVLFDRVRHSDVLQYLWWINTFAPKVGRFPILSN